MAEGKVRGEKWRVTANEYEVSFKGNKNVQKMIVVVAQFCNILKTIGLHTLNQWMVCE